MAASMTIDQAGLPAGTPAVARVDGLRTGALVTLTSNTVGTTYKFQFLWVAALDNTAIGTLIESAPGSPIWTFTPDTDRPGTYRIELIVDEGLPTEQRTIRTFAVATESGIIIPALNERASENASLALNTAVEIEASENNSTSPITAINYQGWWDFYQTVAATRHIKDPFNEQAGSLAAVVVGGWYLKAGAIRAGSRVLLGSDTGIHAVRARLRELASPVPIVAEWTATGTIQDAPEVSGVDVAIPADGWYTLEILSDNALALALLQGVDFIARYARP